MMIPTTAREYVYKHSEQTELRSKGYAAVSYIDHISDGRKVTGTEDFSLERWRKTIVSRAVYMPTGAKDKGGHRRWESVGSVRARSAKDCGIIARIVYLGQEISIRQY